MSLKCCTYWNEMEIFSENRCQKNWRKAKLMHHCIALIWFHPVMCPLLSVQNGRGHYTERCICKLKSSKLLLSFNCNCNMFQVSEMGYLSIAAQNVFSCHDQRSKQAKSETRKIQNPKHPQINSIKIQNSPPIKSLKNSKTQSIPYLRWGKVRRKVCTVGARQTTPAFGEGLSFSLGFWSFGKSRW